MSHVIYLNNICEREFGYKLATIHYIATNKIIHVYFSYMTYLMSHVIFLNNTCG